MTGGNVRDGCGRIIARLVMILLFMSLCGRFCKASKISFEGGAYENILIALNENLPEGDCGKLLDNISETFSVASTYLQEVTGGKARFGTLRILIPRNWTGTSCNGTAVLAEKDDVYEVADIKISEHPIAMKLPWAEQHQGCGKSGEAIYSPPSFFTSANFTLEERSKIFLHEWIKFRYGVFEEYGLVNDDYYSPCHKSGGGLHFTSCTTPRLSQLEQASSDLSCEALLTRNKDNLLKQLATASSSILFAPHRVNTKGTSLCSNVTHNVAAPTKQNFQCYRKSSSEIVFSHADFQLVSSAAVIEKKLSNEILKTELIKHFTRELQAYAFVIEDTTDIRAKNKARHVKQSIAEFLHFVDESGSSNNIALLLRFGNGGEIGIEGLSSLDQYNAKKHFLNRIPDTDNTPVWNVKSANTTEDVKDATLLNVFTRLNESLKEVNSRDRKWNVIFIGNSDPGDLSSTLEFVKQTDFSVSVVTFDSSSEWLRWNSIKQTKKLLHLPLCDEDQSPCSTITSSLLTDHLLEILSSQQPKRYFQKVIDVDFRGKEILRQFVPQKISDLNYKKFLLSLPRYSVNTTSYITHPGGRDCSLTELYEFSGLLFTNSSGSSGCGYQDGTWVARLSGVPADKLNATHVVRGFVEVEEKTGILVIPSIASDIMKPIYPTTQNMMVPLHVAVKQAADVPVIKAEVEAKISFGNETGIFTTTLALKDDGVDPDITRNDGVYSGFVFGYSASPSFHSGFINVKTTTSTEGLLSIQTDSIKAALLDERMETKCCGSSVPLGEVSRVGQMYYSAVLPSFRTGEQISDPLTSPPSRIVLVEEVDQTEEYIRVQFLAPKADVRGGLVDHYDLCLLCDDCKCKDIPTTDCLPVTSGGSQDCKIDKTGLLETFVNPAELVDKTEITITCGIRGVNTANLSGALSFSPIEILLLAENYNNETTAPLLECNYISDGCLPITIFWVLIGLMSGLVFLLIMVTLCWFCTARKERTKNKESVTNPSQNLSREHSSRTLHPKSSDKNGMNDEFATRDLFSRTIHRPPSPDEQVDNSFFNNVRRRSISSVDLSTRFHSNETPDVKLASSVEFQGDMNEMPVFFANGGLKNLKISKSSFKKPENTTYFENQPTNENYFPQRNSRVPSNQFQQTHAYPNSSVHNSNATLAVPSVSSMVDMKMSDESLNYREPVYASVNRNGRRSGTHLGNDRNSGMSLPSNGNFQNSRNVSHVFPPYPNSTKSAKPQSLNSLDSGFARSQSQILSAPIIRMDHFPSSESETYSEASRGGGNPPPPPPPMPSSLNATSGIPRRHHTVTAPDDSKEIPITPRYASRTPPKENRFGILAQMGPIPDRQSVLKPRTGPPPPPPRSNSVRKPPPSYINTSPYCDPYNSRKPNNVEQNENNFDDENDSDTWDVYDEFEFNPGVSHV